MGIIIYVERIGRCIEGKYIKESRGKLLEYKTVGEFLADIKKKFRGGDEESVKVAELKTLKQESKTIEEFVQEFKRAVRESGYERRLLMEEFKRGMNRTIH